MDRNRFFAVTLMLMTVVMAACSSGAPSLQPLQPVSTVNSGSPAEDFPLNPGTYWVYKGNVKWQDGVATHETAVTWRMEVIRAQQVGRYEVFFLEGHPEDLAWFTPGKPREVHIIVKSGGKYYEIQSSNDPVALLADESSLTAKLNAGSLFLELPLQNGMCLGRDPDDKRDDVMYCWSVGAPIPASLDGVKGIPAGKNYSDYELAYRTNPDHTIIHFVPGIGIESYVYAHHGSVSEADVHLVEYHPSL